MSIATGVVTGRGPPSGMATEWVRCTFTSQKDRLVTPNSVTVPERLVRPHPFVAATRDAAGGLKVGEDGRLRIGGREGIVYVVVSREQLQRALRILEALLKEAERRGYELRGIQKGG